MREIIIWLREIEHLASEVYALAATMNWDDKKFTKLLVQLAEEEAYHFHVVGSAAAYLESGKAIVPAIVLDNETKERISNYFFDMKKGLEDGSFTQEELFERIIVAELSEWNDIFLYLVRSLKERLTEFKYPAARIQSHLKEIEHYSSSFSSMSNLVKKIRGLSPVWIEKILIVEDDELVADLIKSLLRRDGDIDIARNGAEGMKMIEKKYYKLVISDIDMPIMDGISLFKEAVGKFPNLSSRFIFMTGDLSPEREEFFANNNLKYLAKPMEIKAVKDMSMNVLLAN